MVSTDGVSIDQAYNGDSCARVKHILIRITAPTTETQDLPLGADITACMDNCMSQLLALETVTLETFCASDNFILPTSLQSVHVSGRIRQRTCREGQTIAEAAERADRSCSGILSPLWSLAKYESQRRALYVESSYSARCQYQCSSQRRWKVMERYEQRKAMVARAPPNASQDGDMTNVGPDVCASRPAGELTTARRDGLRLHSDRTTDPNSVKASDVAVVPVDSASTGTRDVRRNTSVL